MLYRERTEPFSLLAVYQAEDGGCVLGDLRPNPMEVSMTRWILGAAAATLLCASSSGALANQSGAVTGGVAGAIGGAAVGGPVGAVVGGFGGAAIGNSMTNHHYYHHHYVYHHHPYYHPYYRY
jgi:hypothetical protein